jgi:hypothetical protein
MIPEFCCICTSQAVLLSCRPYAVASLNTFVAAGMTVTSSSGCFLLQHLHNAAAHTQPLPACLLLLLLLL